MKALVRVLPRVYGRCVACPVPSRLQSASCVRHKTIAVALSGGVDSSVAALLLKRQGHKIFGIYMKNWEEEEEKGENKQVKHCSSAQDLLDVKSTCKQLDMELKQVNFVKEYWTDVFEPMLDGYLSDLTPNPDVACNRQIKFKLLLQHAFKLGADYLATGHYARLDHACDGTKLLRARDYNKDQSYFLSNVDGKCFDRVLFPLGDLLKSEVRNIAIEAHLPSARKRESMGLCFVGKRNFEDFISNYIPDDDPDVRSKMGNFVDLETGQVYGAHKGTHFYTIGKGARISGAPTKLYVCEKRGSDIMVVPGTNHDALLSLSCLVGPPHWISGKLPEELAAGGEFRCQCRLRNLGDIVPCSLRVMSQERIREGSLPEKTCKYYNLRVPRGGEEGELLILEVRFEEPQYAVAPGQVCSFYQGDECLGCGAILKSGPSLWAQRQQAADGDSLAGP
uniref:tRNA-5-taurinomethyluridine 2-sulfurtransferase n=2 Tax=Guillardia theta TaxID=55529 RepID=A0A7S4NK88_GUITH